MHIAVAIPKTSAKYIGKQKGVERKAKSIRKVPKITNVPKKNEVLNLPFPYSQSSRQKYTNKSTKSIKRFINVFIQVISII